MYDDCSVCHLKYEREPGYFLGAMYISYGLALFTIALLSLVVWAITNWWITKAAIWGMVVFLPFAPMITLLSRVLWIYLDQGVDPARPTSS
ncbi:MAG TPA: hypothetical protein VH088_21375 [Terriglobales bacterium]|jgi:hypothetical protein|nr:hypothetical protein [Terriglobales bacterium]